MGLRDALLGAAVGSSIKGGKVTSVRDHKHFKEVTVERKGGGTSEYTVTKHDPKEVFPEGTVNPSGDNFILRGWRAARGE